MSNKVKFGLKNLYIASVTVGEGNAITFGNPVSWPGSVSLTMDPQGESNPFYADDSKFYVSTSNDGYEVTLETALVPDWFLKDYLGHSLHYACHTKHVRYANKWRVLKGMLSRIRNIGKLPHKLRKLF